MLLVRYVRITKPVTVQGFFAVFPSVGGKQAGPMENVGSKKPACLMALAGPLKELTEIG